MFIVEKTDIPKFYFAAQTARIDSVRRIVHIWFNVQHFYHMMRSGSCNMQHFIHLCHEGNWLVKNVEIKEERNQIFDSHFPAQRGLTTEQDYYHQSYTCQKFNGW